MTRQHSPSSIGGTEVCSSLKARELFGGRLLVLHFGLSLLKIQLGNWNNLVLLQSKGNFLAGLGIFARRFQRQANIGLVVGPVAHYLWIARSPRARDWEERHRATRPANVAGVRLSPCHHRQSGGGCKGITGLG